MLSVLCAGSPLMAGRQSAALPGRAAAVVYSCKYRWHFHSISAQSGISFTAQLPSGS